MKTATRVGFLLAVATVLFVCSPLSYIACNMLFTPVRTKTFRVTSIVSGAELGLRRHANVKLHGILIPARIEDRTKGYLQKYILHHLVILPADSNGEGVDFAYLWGANIPDKRPEKFPIEARGFQDVGDGLFVVPKGAAWNISAMLLREGLAIVDTDLDSLVEARLKEVQALAQADKLGLWEQPAGQ